MNSYTEFTGKSSAKGRNGYFKLAKGRLTVLPHGVEPTTPVHVDLESRRPGESAPIRMELAWDDVEALIGLLAKGLGEKPKAVESLDGGE